MPKKLDEFHWHEVLDRSLLAFEFFDERVATHPAVQNTPELRRQATEISARLFRLYQTIGSLTPDRTPQRPKSPSRRAKDNKP